MRLTHRQDRHGGAVLLEGGMRGAEAVWEPRGGWDWSCGHVGLGGDRRLGCVS